MRLIGELVRAAGAGRPIDLARLARRTDRALVDYALAEAIAGQHRCAGAFARYAEDARATASRLEALRPLSRRGGLRCIQGGQP